MVAAASIANPCPDRLEVLGVPDIVEAQDGPGRRTLARRSPHPWEGVAESSSNGSIAVTQASRDASVVGATLGHVEVTAHDQWAGLLVQHRHKLIDFALASIGVERARQP